MIRHYLKIAFRNLIKYKTQTIISIIGLSVGFTCFALSTFWIHYEMTYDAFLKGSERTYILYKESVLENSGFDTSSPYPLSTYLKRDFPEIEAACALTRWQNVEISVEGQSPLEGMLPHFFNPLILPASGSFQPGQFMLQYTLEIKNELRE